MTCPKTLFSTSLSGSARATEERIRNIFLPNKKRPPIPIITILGLCAVLCGGLVSCEKEDNTSSFLSPSVLQTGPSYIAPQGAHSETATPLSGLTSISDPYQVLDLLEFPNLVGSGTSKIIGTSNRKHNVKLSAQACNNIVLMPGEVFSYNDIIGTVSIEKGYLPAAGDDTTGENIGDGLCQTSSTIYYAVLYSTLEIIERHSHTYATGYVPDGMDATVYPGALDLRFKNNTIFPIKIVTKTYEENGTEYLCVDIFGTNVDGRYAKAESVQFDWVDPTKIYLPDAMAPRGTTTTEVNQNPYTGRKAQVYRHIYEAEGTLVETQDLGVSTYKMRPETIHYNPLDGPLTETNATAQ